MVVLFVGLLGGCAMQKQADTQITPVQYTSSSSSTLPNDEYYFSCENNNFPFRIDDDDTGHGSFTWNGTVVTQRENAEWDPDMPPDWQTAVYLKVSDDKSSAFSYFKKIAENNGVNEMKEQALLFKLGAIYDGKFNTRASISESMRIKILESSQTKESLNLTFIVPIDAGHGMAFNESIACEIL